MFQLYGDLIKNHYADFNGRLSRKDYWLFVAANIIVSLCIGIISYVVFRSSLLDYIYSLALLFPGIGACIRRLHDTGRSGWWYLLSLTGVGAIVIIVFFCLPGDEGNNAYGKAPTSILLNEPHRRSEKASDIDGDEYDDDAETILAPAIEDDEVTLAADITDDEDGEPKACLTRLSDNETINLRGWSYSIGKDSTKSDYMVSSKKTVSRKHATIYYSNGKYYLTDNGSTNGTYINGKKVTSGKDYLIQDNDIIRLSNEEFEFRAM